MKTNIRINSVEIENLKNVNYGKFNSQTNFTNMEKSDLLGFYGQNGSGKTSVVDAFSIIECLLQRLSLNEIKKILIGPSDDFFKITYTFLVMIDDKEYFLKYYVKVGQNENAEYYVEQEELQYKENEKNKRYKSLVLFKNKKIFIRNQEHLNLKDQLKIASEVAIKLAEREQTSVIFQDDINENLSLIINEAEKKLYLALTVEFFSNLHVIDNTDYGLLITNLAIPFNISHDKLKGKVPIVGDTFDKENEKEFLFPESLFKLFKNEIFPEMNTVLNQIIPGMKIEINETGRKLKKNGKQGIRIELISNRNGIKLPLSEESDGIIKIVSYLSLFGALFKNPNACIVIDELDSGIFEYLLGELLKIISESSKGQIIFTSHNLRIVELLPIKKLWFTTTNESNRYIQLKNTSSTSNNRDVYIRAIQMKNQKEELYEKTNNFKIKTAFKKMAIKGKDNG